MTVILTNKPYNASKALEQIYKNKDDILNKVDLTNTKWASCASSPSKKHTDLVLGVSGDKYIAPDEGWFAISKITGESTHTYCDLHNVTAGFIVRSNSSGSKTTAHSLKCRVSKNDEVKVYYNAIGETHIFRFIFAKGVQND